MDELNLSTPTKFSGKISLSDSSFETTFDLHITRGGSLHFDFPKLPFNKNTHFIEIADKNSSSKFADFSLVGVAVDGTSFHTDILHINSISRSVGSSDAGLGTLRAQLDREGRDKPGHDARKR